MNRKLLVTTALVALVGATNVYAEELPGYIEVGPGTIIDKDYLGHDGKPIADETDTRFSFFGTNSDITLANDVTMGNFVTLDGNIIMTSSGEDTKKLTITGYLTQTASGSDLSDINLAIQKGLVNGKNEGELVLGNDLTVGNVEFADGTGIYLHGEDPIQKELKIAEDKTVSFTGENYITGTAGTSLKTSGGNLEVKENGVLTLGNDLIVSSGKLILEDNTEINSIYANNINLDGSNITGEVEEILAKAPMLVVEGTSKTNQNIFIKDGLAKVDGTLTIESERLGFLAPSGPSLGSIILQNGKYASIIDINGTINANVEGSEKAQITFWDSDAKITGDVDNIADLNIRSDLSLQSAFEKGARNIGSVSVYDSALTLDNDNFYEAKNLILNGTSVAKFEKDFTVENKVKVKDGAKLDLGTSTLNTGILELFNGSSVDLHVASLEEYGKIAADEIYFGRGKDDGETPYDNIKLNVTLDNGILKKGESENLDFLKANDVYDGDFNSVKFEDNQRYHFDHIENGTYKITGIATAADIAKKSGGSESNAAAANAWDNVKHDSVTNLIAQRISQALNKLSQKSGSEQEYVDTLTALAPEASPHVQSTTTETTNQVFSAVGSRLNGGSVASSQQGMSSGDNPFKQVSVWIQGLFNKSKLSKNTSGRGFDADTYGTAIGIEKQIDAKAKAGIGYAFSRTDIKSFMRKTDVDTNTAIVYGEYKPTSNSYLNAIATYSFADYKEKKHVAGSHIKSSYDVDSFGLQAIGGYNFDVQGTTLTPEAGLRYVHFRQKAYTDDAGQRISANNSDILTGILGAKVAKTWSLENGFSFTPEARAAMTYDLSHDNANSVVTLANGSSYTAQGEALKRFGMEFGAGVSTEINDKIELSVGYEGKFRKHYKDHSGIVNAKYKF